MDKVFISCKYKNDLSDYVDVFRKYLSNTGFITYVSFNNRDNENKLIDFIDQSSLFICFIDTKSAELMFELGYAIAKKKYIILVGESNNLPEYLKNYTFISNCINRNELFLKIENSLRQYINNNNDHFYFKNCKDFLEKSLIEPMYFDKIDNTEFECIVYQLFKDNNCNIEKNNNNENYDFILNDYFGKRVIIEVKKVTYNTKLSIAVVNQLLCAMDMENAEESILITNGQYTESVLHFAHELNKKVHLWTTANLIDLKRSLKNIHTKKTVSPSKA